MRYQTWKGIEYGNDFKYDTRRYINLLFRKEETYSTSCSFFTRIVKEWGKDKVMEEVEQEMKRKVLGNVRKALRSSSVVAASQAGKGGGKKSGLFGVKAKPVSHAAVAAREANGCWCDDWSGVKAVPGGDPDRP